MYVCVALCVCWYTLSLISSSSAVIVEFQPSSYTVDEDEGVVRFSIVKRTRTTQGVTVQFTTQNGSATGRLCIAAEYSSDLFCGLYSLDMFFYVHKLFQQYMCILLYIYILLQPLETTLQYLVR